MSSQELSWSDWEYPIWRNEGAVTIERWLEGRRKSDGAEGLWRVHDSLYDLSSWVDAHPGGSDWLTTTKGMDITEAFEAHHIRPLASKLLANFYVRPAQTKRNSPFTFNTDGFYHSLKKRVYEKIKNTKPGPSRQSKMTLDFLATTAVSLSVLAAVYQSVSLVTAAGVLLTLTGVSAHNFFHMRDNWRMYLFNLTFLTVREWRISHALSHHLYPNTHYDMEISLFEPFLIYLPKVDKMKMFAIMSVIYSPLVYLFLYFSALFTRLMSLRYQMQDLIPLMLPILMTVVGQVTLWQALVTWVFVLMVSSVAFCVIGVNAAHHHPDIFHYGDRPRDDRDWGLFTLDATRDRVEVQGSLFLILTTFGDHTLHHLFPAIDHAHLHGLYPILESTCKEFGIDYKLTTTWDLITGQYKQLLRNKPNLNERTY